MYLSKLKIWNFRKYSCGSGNSIEESRPGLEIEFTKGINVLVGENDSGKSAIVDAVKHVLYTQSYDFLRIEDKDFFKPESGERTNELRIDCEFQDFNPAEAASFLEWLGFDENKEYLLKIRLTARRKDNRIITDIKAGPDDEGTQLESAARDILRVTYLKPLRDAEAELTPGYRSRFAQILRSNKLFQKQKGEDGKEVEHILEKYIKDANKLIEGYFENDKIDATTPGAKQIKDQIKGFLLSFFPENSDPDPFVRISGTELIDILNRLSLNLEENKSGLGALNLLFIAAELLLLQREEHNGLKLALIEEIEAHLHPQAQLRLIDFLQKEQDKHNNQFILTTHSTTLASKIALNNLIICKGAEVYPMHEGKTELDGEDYEYLQRFLDATKANLFFARGVIIVEGDAENLLIPTIAELLGRSLHSYGVSIVNVGNKGLMRYAKIFRRKDGKSMRMPVACVTDLDIAHRISNGNIDIKPRGKKKITPDVNKEIKKLESEFNAQNVKVFHSPLWTLEFDLAQGELGKLLFQAIYVAQLVQGRTKHHNFKGLKKDEIDKRRQEADKKFGEWQAKYSSDKKMLAYKVYDRLRTLKASKAVTAQYLSNFLLEFMREKDKQKRKEKEEGIKQIIKTDEQLKYIREAIEHVTESL